LQKLTEYPIIINSIVATRQVESIMDNDIVVVVCGLRMDLTGIGFIVNEKGLDLSLFKKINAIILLEDGLKVQKKFEK
jgi:hypothetical protein